MTARRVARQRLGFARVLADYGRPEDDDRLQADVAAGLADASSGMSRYLASRTRFFDGAVTAAIAAGVRQLVAVGAGYDGRSLRYGRSGVTWFELDHPATQLDKLNRLERLGIETVGVCFGAVDFGTGDVPGVLGELGHDRGLPTQFFCEGVAPYLPRAVLDGLLAALSGISAPGSGLAIEIPLVATTPEQAARRAALGRRVAGLGEPLRTAVGRDEWEQLLQRAGWAVESAADPAGQPIETSVSAVVFARAVLAK
jgi:methyltransferase (TIGR00027 family)